MSRSTQDSSNHRRPPEAAEARCRIEAARGLIALGAGEEALLELQPILSGPFHDSRVEDARLLAQSMARGPKEIIGAVTVALLREEATDDILMTGYIEALNLRMPDLTLFFLDRCTPWHQKEAVALHCRACAASQLGFHESALECISEALDRSDDPESLLIDAHLAPTWHHYAATMPRLWEARMLTQATFVRLARQCPGERRTRPVCWNTAQTCAPRRILPFLVRDPELFVAPRPSAPRGIRRAYGRWLNERRGRMARVLRRAIQNARQVMAALKPQPG